MTLNVHFGIKFASQSSLIFLPKVQLTPHFDLMQETADLVTFTEEILNGKLHVLCSDYIYSFSYLSWTQDINWKTFRITPECFLNVLC